MENLSVDDVDDVVDGGGRDQCEECNYDVPPVICSYNTPLSRQTPDHSFLASCNFKSIQANSAHLLPPPSLLPPRDTNNENEANIT